jgi:hypothetical protein
LPAIVDEFTSGGVWTFVDDADAGFRLVAGNPSALELVSAGGVAVASSQYSGSFPASATINGERAGAGFGAGGVWADANPVVYPDWVQVNFNGMKNVSRMVFFRSRILPALRASPRTP